MIEASKTDIDRFKTGTFGNAKIPTHGCIGNEGAIFDFEEFEAREFAEVEFRH